jgi:hypothetical protein
VSDTHTEAVVVMDVGRRKMLVKCDVYIQALCIYIYIYMCVCVCVCVCVWIHREDRYVLCYTEPSKRKGKHLYMVKRLKHPTQAQDQIKRGTTCLYRSD